MTRGNRILLAGAHLQLSFCGRGTKPARFVKKGFVMMPTCLDSHFARVECVLVRSLRLCWAFDRDLVLKRVGSRNVAFLMNVLVELALVVLLRRRKARVRPCTFFLLKVRTEMSWRRSFLVLLVPCSQREGILGSKSVAAWERSNYSSLWWLDWLDVVVEQETHVVE